jgi:hypothetical protein
MKMPKHLAKHILTTLKTGNDEIVPEDCNLSCPVKMVHGQRRKRGWRAEPASPAMIETEIAAAG